MASCLRSAGQSRSPTSLLLSTSEWALSVSAPWVEDLGLSLCGEAEWHACMSGLLGPSLSFCLFQSFCTSSWSWALIYDLFFLKSLSTQRKEGGGERKEGGGERNDRGGDRKDRVWDRRMTWRGGNRQRQAGRQKEWKIERRGRGRRQKEKQKR